VENFGARALSPSFVKKGGEGREGKENLPSELHKPQSLQTSKVLGEKEKKAIIFGGGTVVYFLFREGVEGGECPGISSLY